MQSTTMSTSSRQQQPHHHHTSSRSQLALLNKLSSIIPPSSTNLQIDLIEPTLYFRGDAEESVGCFLRGNLILNLPKPTKIRKIDMKFVGKMKTYWPEGKLHREPPTSRSNNLYEEQEIMKHTWSFLSSSSTSPFETLPPPSPTSSSNSNRFKILHRSSAPASPPKFHLIPAGTHKYPFELFIPGNIPETIKTDRGTVSYKLNAIAVRSGLSPNLHVTQNVSIIRTVLEERNSEGIAIASEWNNQLGYEITIPKRAYPIGDSIDVDLKLSPRMKKFKVDKVKVQLKEESVYKTKGQRLVESRTLLTHKVDLTGQETISDKNHSTNNNDTAQERSSSSTHIQDDDNLLYHENISVPIPKCTSPIYFSYVSSSINISHHLKLTFKITNIDDGHDDKKKKKKSDFKVDIPIIPITLLSCICAEDLPQYKDECHNLHDSPSYESPPPYEQSTPQQYSINNEIQHNNSIDTITMTRTTELHRPPLERLLTA